MLQSTTDNHNCEMHSTAGSDCVQERSIDSKSPARPGFQSVPELVGLQAAAAPGALAIADRGTLMSYGELDARANRLANYFLALGAGPETIVGICLDRSSESIVSALAALKCGAAFLPLDPAYPAERLLFMLNDAQPRLLVTLEANAETISRGPWKTLRLDSDQSYPDSSTDAPIANFTDDQLAYVIYTSGSTGQPKGVAINHGSLLNLVKWHISNFKVTSKDRASHLARVGFDAAVWEVWPYLAAGASLHLPDENTRVAPEQLRDWFVREKVSIGFLPTALAERVMSLDWPTGTALRILLTGADTLHRYPNDNLPFKLINNYGPTECTVVATSGSVQPGLIAGHLPAIGRPISNTTVYILDANLQPVPTGHQGELHIGGAGVARGYLNRTDLTNERFINDPFSAQPGARLYRTGDLAKYLESGEIAFLGRLDEQIKFLGYRIEPAEIEAVLNRHPAIDSSIVIARGSGDEKRLTAYLITQSATTLSASDLRDFLKSELPEYMIPAIFVHLHNLPMLASGKVDRLALPEPDIDNTLRDDSFVTPRTPVERRLSMILTSLLNLNDVSVHDNFFLLGGHSLLGTQLIARIRGAFGVDLSLRTLFESPTIADLSSEIERLIIARVESMTEEEAESLLA